MRRRSASGTAVNRRAKQLKPDEVDALVAHYRKNESVVDAANALGVTRQTAAKYLCAAGIATVRRMTDTDVADAVRAYEGGQSASRIGSRLGFDPQTVLTALRNSGVQIRPRPGR